VSGGVAHTPSRIGVAHGLLRELENAVERAVVLTSSNLIPLSVLRHVMPAFADSQHSLSFKIGTTWRELERQAVEITLAHTRGNKRIAARLLGVAVRTIYRHLEEQEQNDQGEEHASKSTAAKSIAADDLPS
jgi:two-component system, NtrC family, response regulator HydG